MSLPSIGPLELIIILAIALLIVGPKRLPEMGNAFGRTIREFRKATTEVSESTNLTADAKPVSPPAPASGTPADAAMPASLEPDAAVSQASPDAQAAAPDRDDDANRPV